MPNHWIAKIALILAIVMLSTSCNMQGERQIINEKTETLQGQIFLWVQIPFGLTEAQSGKDQRVLKKTLKEFRELYPQVQVFVKFLPKGGISKSLELELRRGSGPDLFLTYATSNIFPLINTGAFRTLDESEVDLSQFRSESVKHVRYQGKIYGLPIYLLTQVLCYNKDKVKELPQTLPELIEQARRGYSVGVHSSFVEAFWGTGIFGGRPFDDQGRFILDQGGGWANWMEWLTRAQNEPNFILSNDAEALQEAFVEDKLAYVTCSSSWIPYFREQLGKNKLGATLLPRNSNRSATPVLRTGALLFNRASSPNQYRLALKLAQFLTNLEQQNQMEAEMPFIASNKNVTINRQLFPVRAALLDQSKSTVAVPLDYAPIVEVIIQNGEILYQQILAGEITPSQAANQLTLIVNRQIDLNSIINDK